MEVFKNLMNKPKINHFNHVFTKFTIKCYKCIYILSNYEQTKKATI